MPTKRAQLKALAAAILIGGICFVIMGWLLQLYHRIGGVVPIFDTLPSQWQNSIVIFILLVLNVVLYFGLTTWWFVVRDSKAANQEDKSTSP